MVQWLQRRYAQMVTGLYVDRCDPNLTVWGQLGWAEFFEAFYSVATPSWKDDIDLLTGKSWLKHARKDLKRAEAVTPEWLTDIGEFLGAFAEKQDKLMFFIFLAQVGFSFLVEWASAAYQVERCQVRPAYGNWKSVQPLGFWDNQTEWVEGPIWIASSGNQGAIKSSEVTIPAGGEGYFYAACKFGDFTGLGHLISWDTRVIDESDRVLSSHHYVPSPDGHSGGPIDFVWFEAANHDRVLRYQWRPQILGQFEETTVTSGIAAASWSDPKDRIGAIMRGKIPRKYDFKSILDPEFKPID